MSYTVRIKNNATGEIRSSRQFDIPWEEHSDFMWLEGNMGCDCNRDMEWRRAGGEVIEDIMAFECSDGRFRVIDATLSDGRVVKLQGEEK